MPTDSIYKTFRLPILLYEGIVVVLLIAYLIPDDLSFAEFASDPLASMNIDEITFALVLGLFLPWILPHIRRLKIFGFEAERFERVVKEVKGGMEEMKRESIQQRYDQERALYVLAAASERRMDKTLSRRLNRSLQEAELEIGMKNFPESRLLAEIMYRVLRHLPVSRPTRQESTLLTFFNLRSGKIDLYVEYSGVGFLLAGRQEEQEGTWTAEGSRERLNELYEPWDLTWLSPIGFDNQHELIMLKKKADEFNIETVTDVIKQSQHLVIAANREYYIRQSTFPRLERLSEQRDLNLRFRNRKEVDIGDRYSGLFAGDFDVGVGWTTDSQIVDPRLKRIRYDERFPPISQYAMPLCHKDVMDQIAEPLSQLHIESNEMIGLNEKAQLDGNRPQAIRGIAERFCKRYR